MKTQNLTGLAPWLIVLSAAFLAAAGDAGTIGNAGGEVEPVDGWKKEHFVIGYGNPQEAWVDNIPAKEAWKPVAQPDLADRLKAAPRLTTLKVGPPVQVVGNTRGHVLLVPNRDGTTWDALFHYFESYKGEQEVIVADLGTGEQKTLWFNSQREGGRKEFVAPFGGWYAHGKLFAPGDASNISWYDPESNDIIYKEFGGPKFHCHVRHLGDDQNIYYFGTPVGRKHYKKERAYVPAVFNTKTLEMTWHDPVGPDNRNVVIFYPKGCKDGDWLYSAIGKRPWRLHAYNFKTREYKLLATAPIIGDYSTIKFKRVAGGGISGYVREADFVAGITEFDKKEFEFWLKDGTVYARTGNIPPWSKEPAKKGPPIEHIFRTWGNIQMWPRGWTPPSPPPCFDGTDSATADSEGNVTRRYRLGGKGEWRTIRFKVSGYDSPTAFLTEVNDHTIFAAANQYAEHTFYKLKTRQFMGSGGSGISTCAMGVTAGGFYVCGYPNSILAAYDLAQPLAGENPRGINSFASHSDTHYPWGGVVRGADGRIYTGGSGAGRTRRGGGWSWYDPKSGELGGEKLEENILSVAAVCDARYILMSTRHKEGSRLFCWDTATHEFTYKKELEGLDHAGYLVEALPGLVLGHAAKTVGETTVDVLYGLDPLTANVLWTKEVPARYKSTSLGYGGRFIFRRGPDGFIWCYFNKVLVRIDPRTAEVIPVGTLPARPAYFGFAGGDVYVAGEIGLCRIKGLTVPVVERHAAGSVNQ